MHSCNISSYLQVVYQTSTSTTQLDLSDSAYLDNITLTNLRIRLLRFHHLPGNDPSDPQTAVRQFYAIYNLDVFGWCFCNGHETTCDFSKEEASTSNMVSDYIFNDFHTGQQFCLKNKFMLIYYFVNTNIAMY